MWIDKYKADGIAISEIMMALAMSGPKANIEEDDYIVEIDDNFFTEL